MNVELRKLQENMVHIINSAQLPTEAKRLVVFELLHKLEVQAEKDIMFELQEIAKEKEKENE